MAVGLVVRLLGLDYSDEGDTSQTRSFGGSLDFPCFLSS